MFSHIMVGTNDIEESKIFYDKLFEVLGAGPGKMYPSRTGQKRYFSKKTYLKKQWVNIY